jgi:hypothetical protein
MPIGAVAPSEVWVGAEVLLKTSFILVVNSARMEEDRDSSVWGSVSAMEGDKKDW